MNKSIYTEEYRLFLLRLRKARSEAGLTQVQVAHLLKRHQSYISKCESGERRIDIIELTAFARIYGKDLDYFIQKDSGVSSP